MKTVRIIKNWDWPDLMRQTPGHEGNWDGIHFTLEAVDECDYVIVLNLVPKNTMVICPPHHVWAIMQESALPAYKRQLLRGTDKFYRVYTADDSLRNSKYFYSHGAEPWHIDKDYDTLKVCQVPDKTRVLSWVTSNKAILKGHRDRMTFLRKIRGRIEFDLFGRGFTPILDKWSALAPYRYALAIENFNGPYGWTEKLADCFLSWTMPIYYGCTNLEDYFPKESFVRIDIRSSEAIRVIRDVICSDLWFKSREAIAYSRELVLEKYQFFPFVSEQIREFESRKASHHDHQKRKIYLPAQRELKPPFWGRVVNYVERYLKLGIWNLSIY